MIETLAWVAAAVCAVACVVVAAYAVSRLSRRDRHTWIDDLFVSEEA